MTKQPQWLDNAVFYEIYPQSFNDTNSDGIGDIKGITEKLDYICELGCNAIWINPCFKSPFGDAGYDLRTITQSLHVMALMRTWLSFLTRLTSVICMSSSTLYPVILLLLTSGLRNQ